MKLSNSFNKINDTYQVGCINLAGLIHIYLILLEKNKVINQNCIHNIGMGS